MFSVLIPLIITAITMIVNAAQARRQYKLDFFKEFTRRYQEILLASDGEQADSRGIPKRIVMYFNLCSEEFYLHRRDIFCLMCGISGKRECAVVFLHRIISLPGRYVVLIITLNLKVI